MLARASAFSTRPLFTHRRVGRRRVRGVVKHTYATMTRALELRNASSRRRSRAKRRLGALALFVVFVSCLSLCARAEERGDEETLVLPPRDDTDDGSGPRVRQIKFGEKVAVDDIGPVVINHDCTTSYIENWDGMTEREQEATRRRLGERNRARHAECKRKERDGEL